jgi:hypothetical protein
MSLEVAGQFGGGGHSGEFIELHPVGDVEQAGIKPNPIRRPGHPHRHSITKIMRILPRHIHLGDASIEQVVLGCRQLTTGHGVGLGIDEKRELHSPTVAAWAR